MHQTFDFFSGWSAKTEKSNYSFCHVCLFVFTSVRMKQLGSNWTYFYKSLYLSIFLKYVEKIQASLKSKLITGNLHGDQCSVLIISRSLLLRKRNNSDKSCRENQNTHFTFNSFFFSKVVPLWYNMEKHFTARHATDDNMANVHCILNS